MACRFVLPLGATLACMSVASHAQAEEVATHIRIDGEVQVRGRAQTKYLLFPTASRVRQVPGLDNDSTGQGAYASDWIRITPRLELTKRFSFVGQGDFAHDVLLGDRSRGVLADRFPRDRSSFSPTFRPRALYLQATFDELSIRLGHVPIHWGEGMVWNDGTVRSLFGDYRGGDISERLVVETTPRGPARVSFGYAQDFVFEDAETRLIDGDRAVAVSGFVRAATPTGRLGALVSYKSHTSGASVRAPFGDKLDRLLLDATGSIERPAAMLDGYVHAGFEAAATIGSVGTREVDGTRGITQSLHAYGFLVRADISALAFEAEGGPLPSSYPCDESCRTALAHRGRIELGAELGFASGDGTPSSGTFSRFSFDPNHRVGLLMFDELVRATTARSATAGTDPALAPSARLARSPELFPSQGGVAGAAYVYPTLVYRPVRAFDVRFAAVKGHATASNVDLYVSRMAGRARGPRGGSPEERDLGIELDLGVEGRIRMPFMSYVSLGAEGAVLFAGRAFDNGAGGSLPRLWLGQVRAGYVF